jgi:hypothetical protein
MTTSRASAVYWCRLDNERRYISARVDLKSEDDVWLSTAALKAALAEGQVVRCYEIFLTKENVEHRRAWQRLRNKLLKHMAIVVCAVGRQRSRSRSIISGRGEIIPSCDTPKRIFSYCVWLVTSTRQMWRVSIEYENRSV